MSLADNVVIFGRVLRAAGVPVATDRILLALEAVCATGIESRDDFHAVLLTCLVDRAEHRLMFERAFAAFWQRLELLEPEPQQSLPRLEGKARGTARAGERRLTEAMFRRTAAREPLPEVPIELKAELAWSDREQLGKADFETLSPEEWSRVQHLVRALGTSLPNRQGRRFKPSARGGRIDLHEALREAARRGGELVIFPRQARRVRPEPLVVIIDISGSMSRYSRMFLHFTYALIQAADRVGARIHVFLFGTRLTNVTHRLRGHDPDVGIAEVVQAVDDWSGGTRIAACLRDFNLVWARRVLPGSATVLLVTDGLECADLGLLASQMERLDKSCRRLIWLNPLLRYAGFEPRAQGVRIMLPFVDRHVPVHNLASLEQLAAALAAGFRARPRVAAGPELRPPRPVGWS